jgi:hypothetical protein
LLMVSGDDLLLMVNGDDLLLMIHRNWCIDYS